MFCCVFFVSSVHEIPILCVCLALFGLVGGGVEYLIVDLAHSTTSVASESDGTRDRERRGNSSRCR